MEQRNRDNCIWMMRDYADALAIVRKDLLRQARRLEAENSPEAVQQFFNEKPLFALCSYLSEEGALFRLERLARRCRGYDGKVYRILHSLRIAWATVERKEDVSEFYDKIEQLIGMDRRCYMLGKALDQVAILDFLDPTERALVFILSCSSPYPASVLAVTLPAYLMQTSPMVCRENDFAVLDYIDDALHARLNLCAHTG